MRITNVDPDIRIRKRQINADLGRRLCSANKIPQKTYVVYTEELRCDEDSVADP
jgi:hypothetical protein